MVSVLCAVYQPACVPTGILSVYVNEAKTMCKVLRVLYLSYFIYLTSTMKWNSHVVTITSISFWYLVLSYF
jgi:hypothetical protein